MGSFVKLVNVENMKLWKRFSTKLMILIMAVIIVGMCGLLKVANDRVQKIAADSNTSQSEKLDWKEKLKQENESLQASIDAAEKSKSFSEKNNLDEMKRQVAENKYRIEHNMKPIENKTNDFWHLMLTAEMWQIVTLFVIIATTALVAKEFSEGTMKTMIPRPFARWQILTAKFIVTLIYALFMTALGYLLTLGSLALFFGASQFGNNVLLWIGGSIVEVPGIVGSLITIGLDFLSTLVYVIFTFALCAVTRSRALATGLSIFLMYGGIISTLISRYFSWGKYIFFADTSFSTFIVNGATTYGLTLSLALVICAVYCVVFLFAGYFTFAKRDIS